MSFIASLLEFVKKSRIDSERVSFADPVVKPEPIVKMPPGEILSFGDFIKKYAALYKLETAKQPEVAPVEVAESEPATADVFVIDQLQHYQFDYTQGDKLSIKAPGVDSLDDLHQHLTATEKGDAGVTWHFGDALSITLAGVQTTELTADMVVFQ